NQTLCRRTHATRTAINKRHTQAFFQLNQPLARGRRRDAQAQRHGRQASGRNKRIKKIQIGRMTGVFFHPFSTFRHKSCEFCRILAPPNISRISAGSLWIGKWKMKSYKIACIPGDGIGKEVIPAGQTVLQALADTLGQFSFAFTAFDWGGDYYRQHGVMMPDDGLDALYDKDAILFGSAGDPDIADHITLW